MQKIMFADKYGLTKAVLEGRKTMTRRAVPEKLIRAIEGGAPGFAVMESKYKVGEVVAVAQKYSEIEIPISGETRIYNEGLDLYQSKLEYELGWSNKMFVKACLLPHHIRITNVRVERLQDISDEDCIREGIEEDSPYYWVPVNMSLPNWRKIEEGVSDMYPNDRDGKVYPHFWDSPRKAFAALIDKVSGKGTFDSNPWVFVYEFELVK